MNKNQKLILAIFVPIIIFFIALMIANSMGVSKVTKILAEDDPFYKLFGMKTRTSYTHDPFDWQKTWCVWLVYSASCCLFEFLLFRDNKIIAKRNKED